MIATWQGAILKNVIGSHYHLRVVVWLPRTITFFKMAPYCTAIMNEDVEKNLGMIACNKEKKDLTKNL
jgi:hypothetical protein